MTGNIVVFNTCGSSAEAAVIARMLVEQRLAACVSVVAPVTSYYRWQGAVETTEEWLLVIKTASTHFDRLRVALEAAHSYEIPELIALPVTLGSGKYLNWLEGELA